MKLALAGNGEERVPAMVNLAGKCSRKRKTKRRGQTVMD
jgi:hypothetical protein